MKNLTGRSIVYTDGKMPRIFQSNGEIEVDVMDVPVHPIADLKVVRSIFRGLEGGEKISRGEVVMVSEEVAHAVKKVRPDLVVLVPVGESETVTKFRITE